MGDKGVPAALVMASTRSVLRSTAQRLDAPGEVLARVNEPRRMFVTCLYAVLDPATGRLRYANAGHLPLYVGGSNGVAEWSVRGLPLAVLPGVAYEEQEATIAPGDIVLLHSDGLVEAHDAQREMFGFERLKGVVAHHHRDARRGWKSAATTPVASSATSGLPLAWPVPGRHVGHPGGKYRPAAIRPQLAPAVKP